jgi:opacity protein-like surface antigen
MGSLDGLHSKCRSLFHYQSQGRGRRLSLKDSALVTLGSWLPYATAGVAFIDAHNNFSVVSADDGPFNFNTGTTDTGFVVGGGVDYKVAPHLSLGLEGLYYDFGS